MKFTICHCWLYLLPFLLDSNLFVTSLLSASSFKLSAYLNRSYMTMSSVDTLMIKTYEELSRRVLMDILKTDPNEQYWICLAGGPGAGKSTLSTAVVNRLNELTGLAEFAVVLPMDGFHFSRKQLREISETAESPTFDELLARRGSPWTFDAKAVCETLLEARKCKEGKRDFGI
jgi:pantothenate kinase